MLIAPPYLVISRSLRPRLTSPGETLWFSLRDLYGTHQGRDFPDKLLFDMSVWSEPHGGLAYFFADVTVGHAVHRLIKAARKIEEKNNLKGDQLHTAEGELLMCTGLREYLVETLAFSFSDQSSLRSIPAMVYAAHRATRHEISLTTRTEVLNEAQRHSTNGSIRCYCCDDLLWSPNCGWTARGIALDHLWPRSLGGVSTADNLLPVCDTCNGAKKDRISWSTYGIVQDYSASSSSGDGELLMSLALHRRAAGKLAEEQNFTLKEAFIKLGSADDLKKINDADERIFFNLHAHNETLLPRLW